MAKKEVTPLPVMVGAAQEFEVAGKQYKLLPLTLKENNEFNGDKIGFGSQFFVVNDPDKKAILEKWLGRHLFDKSGNPATYEMIEEDGWTLPDIKTFWLRLVDISG